MNKKIIYIVSIVIGILLVVSFYTHYIDSARVGNGIEPKFTIKLVDGSSGKVTYWGLGYKVIRYTKVSPSEPFKNSKGVKYGSWFMKFKLGDISEIENIIDTTKDIKDFACDEALEGFYQDDEYIYYYNCIKSSHVLVKFKDGSQMTVAEALKSEFITIKDLDEYKIEYIKYNK